MSTSSKSSGLHLAIIPDGNRRWAKAHRLNPWKGHEQSAKNFKDIIEWCGNSPEIAVLTVWCFSTENWKRDPEEVGKLMEMLENYLIDERATFHKNKMRLVHSGRTDRFTPALATLLKDIQEETAQYDTFTVHLAIDYGGKDEMLRACNRFMKNNKEASFDENAIAKHLDQPSLPEIDLIIRTSGEQRTSNFFLWQSTYAEWMFPETLFPDFGVKDLKECVTKFGERKRRFGS